MRVNCDTAQEYYIQQTIKDKLQGYSFTHPKCTGSVLIELAMELKQIKEDFISAGGIFCCCSIQRQQECMTSSASIKTEVLLFPDLFLLNREVLPCVKGQRSACSHVTSWKK